jgi:hypothetical protein
MFANMQKLVGLPSHLLVNKGVQRTIMQQAAWQWLYRVLFVKNPPLFRIIIINTIGQCLYPTQGQLVIFY